MSEPVIAWRPGWVSEWDGNVLVCVREDHRTTPSPVSAPPETVAAILAAVPANMPAARAVLIQVCGEYGLSYRRLCERTFANSGAAASICWPRYDAFARLRAITDPQGKPRYSWPTIARLVGRWDHTSCITAAAKWVEIEAWIAGFDPPETDAKREAEAA